MAADAGALFAALAATVVPDAAARARGEAALKLLESQPAFLPSLLQVVVAPDSDVAVRLAGAIYFKNRVGRSWDPSKDHPVSQEDKAWVKLHIAEAIAKSEPRARSQILTALSTIITFEFRHGSWPELVHTIKSMLSSDQPQAVYSALLIFLELVKNYQWVAASERQSLHPILREVLPMTLSISNSLKDHAATNIEAAEMLKCIIKTYSSSIRLELCEDQQNMASLVPWGTLFVSIIEMHLPEGALGMPQDPVEREKHVWWKLKKWAYQCFNTMFGRYACVNREKKYNHFSKVFVAQFAPKILESFLKQIGLMTQGMWVSSRVKQHLSTFLEHSVKRKATWAILFGHLEPVVVHFISPLLCFSDADQELWDENPVDYVHKKIDPPIDDFKSPVSAAELLLKTIVGDRTKQSFMPIMNIINGIHTQYNQMAPENRNPRQKYGILNMMSCLVDQLLSEESPVRNDMEAFLVAYVIPDTSSPFPFLRARAIDTLLTFASEMEFSDDKTIDHAFHLLLTSLKDPEVPVRVSAALALMPFFDYPRINDAMKPHAAGVMQELMNLTNEIDMDTLTHVMEKLVFEYSEQLAPFATQLATQLCTTFMRIMSEAKYNTDDFDVDQAEDKAMAAMGVLKTIASLILSIEGSTAILHEVEVIVAPSIAFVLENDVLDLYEETFEIIETATFCSKSISPTLWNLLPLIHRAFLTDAVDYFEEMLLSLQNYLMYGKDVVAQSKDLQQIFFGISSSMLFSDDRGQSDVVRACQLAEIMMLYLRGSIDTMIPKFVEAAYKHLVTKPAKSLPLRIHAIELVVNALFYNATLTLALLEHAQWTMGFLNLWFNNLENMERVHDKRLSILTLGALLEMPVEQYPPALQASWTHLFTGMIGLFESYGPALEERLKDTRVANGEQSDSESDVEDSDDDDSGDVYGVSDDDDDDDGQVDESAHMAAAIQAAGQTHDVDDGDDDDDDDDWSVEDMLEEDIYFETYLDEVDAYVEFTRLAETLTRDGRLSIIEPSLSAAQRTSITKILTTATENQKRKNDAAVAAAAEPSTAA